MGVKERILEVALKLYNERGINAITTRHIAKELEISPGNLHYHFRHTSDIIEALYDEFVAQIEAQMAKFNLGQSIDMTYLYDLNSACFDVIYKYRFGFVNTGDIGYMVPAIRVKNNLLRARRRAQLDVLMNKLIQSGHLRNDLADSIWDALKNHLFILTDSYLSYIQTARQDSQESTKSEFLALYENLFFIYLAQP